MAALTAEKLILIARHVPAKAWSRLWKAVPRLCLLCCVNAWHSCRAPPGKTRTACRLILAAVMLQKSGQSPYKSQSQSQSQSQRGGKNPSSSSSSSGGGVPRNGGNWLIGVRVQQLTDCGQSSIARAPGLGRGGGARDFIRSTCDRYLASRPVR